MDSKTTNDCRFVQPRIDEYVDGGLTRIDAAFVSEHVAVCSPCGALLAQARSTRDLLRSLGQRRVPTGFDAHLAQRIVEIDRRRSLRPMLSGLLGSVQGVSLLRPGLAAATIAIIVLGGVASRQSSTALQPGRQDAALVSQCVAQHQSYMSGEPVSDWSAQNLVGHVNGLDPNGTDDSL